MQEKYKSLSFLGFSGYNIDQNGRVFSLKSQIFLKPFSRPWLNEKKHVALYSNGQPTLFTVDELVRMAFPKKTIWDKINEFFNKL